MKPGDLVNHCGMIYELIGLSDEFAFIRCGTWCFRGKKRDPEIMARVVATRKANWEIRGFKMPPGAIEKTASKNRGRKLTSEHKAKIGAAGRGRPLTEEHKKAISDFHRGRPTPSEVKSKISLSLKQRHIALKDAMISYSVEAM